jgi:N6-adenosine-specific RNA methylase IME4
MNEIITQGGVAGDQLADLERRLGALRRQIASATDCAKVLKLMAMADSLEETMANAGYRGNTEALRPANEIRFEARWKLGQLLAKMEKRQGERTDLTLSRTETKSGFRAYLKEIGLNKSRANECQRIAAIPQPKLKNAFEEKAKEGVLNTIKSMFLFARPFWKMEVRTKRHRAIRNAVVAASSPDKFGPFPLIYADPPTEFETYTEGSYRGPNQHYPTLPWPAIENFTIHGKRINEIAHEDAMLFLWTTSSNLVFALDVMRAWGFGFKASAIWDKGVQGTGLIFRNMHEVLLYGSRGNVPGPVYVPPSVFRYPRGEHSAKPPEIRGEIERMYPDYDADTRLELFSRDTVPGWTHFGFEANAKAAE